MIEYDLMVGTIGGVVIGFPLGWLVATLSIIHTSNKELEDEQHEHAMECRIRYAVIAEVQKWLVNQKEKGG